MEIERVTTADAEELLEITRLHRLMSGSETGSYNK